MLVAVAALVAATVVASQDQSAQNLVELDAVVLDGNDHPMAGLHQEDFQIKEDGRPVEV